MVKRTYTQILEELRRLIVQQSRWRYQVCIEGETEELMNKIAELQEQIDEKTSEIKSYQRRIIASISSFWQQYSAEYNVLVGRFVYQLDWGEITNWQYGKFKPERAKEVFIFVEWERPELMEWLREHTGIDGYEC